MVHDSTKKRFVGESEDIAEEKHEVLQVFRVFLVMYYLHFDDGWKPIPKKHKHATCHPIFNGILWIHVLLQ